MIKYYFVVDKATGKIISIVQRSATPQETSTRRFVLATPVLMTFYYRLLEVQEVVTIDDVLNYGVHTPTSFSVEEEVQPEFK